MNETYSIIKDGDKEYLVLGEDRDETLWLFDRDGNMPEDEFAGLDYFDIIGEMTIKDFINGEKLC